MIGIDRVSDPAFGFDTEHQRVEKILAGHRLHFRQRDNGGGHRTRRMNDGLQVRIVIVEDVAGHAVEECRVHDIEPFAPAEQRGLRRSRERRERGHRDVDRLVMRAADRDTDPVQECPHALFPDIGGKIVVISRDDVMRQLARYVLGRRGLGLSRRRCARGLRECGSGSGRHWKRGCRLNKGPAIGHSHCLKSSQIQRPRV